MIYGVMRAVSLTFKQTVFECEIFKENSLVLRVYSVERDILLKV
jgi:hypothetical protein